MYDLTLSEWIDDRRLGEALAFAFDAEPADVLLDADLGQPTREGMWLQCTCSRRGGEFPFTVSVYPQGQPNRPRPTEAVVAERLHARLRVRVLIPDATPNPFRWMLVDAAGARPVDVDVEAMDRDEFVIDRVLTSRREGTGDWVTGAG
ncbi:MAG: hypothetical protein RL653_676 [Pseudomonadota bacterium]|jgi:hypothetical protein